MPILRWARLEDRMERSRFSEGQSLDLVERGRPGLCIEHMAAIGPRLDPAGLRRLDRPIEFRGDLCCRCSG